MEQITANIFRIRVSGIFNAYLVREQSGLTLIDTTSRPGAAKILRAAQSLGMPIQTIVLTHAHVDHIAGLDTLARHLPNARVFMGEREADLYHQAQRHIRPEHFRLRANEPEQPVRGTYPTMRTPISRKLIDGERIGSLRAIFSPGHTPGHMSFLDQRDRTLIAGDAFTSIGELRVAGDAVWYFPLTNMATWSTALAADSAAKLAGYAPNRVICGHGKPIVDNVSQALESAVHRVGRKIETPPYAIAA
jgi:glyoxylase-like metal-dependent hydrolase (beta-lactamase superfamily II)